MCSVYTPLRHAPCRQPPGASRLRPTGLAGSAFRAGRIISLVQPETPVPHLPLPSHRERKPRILHSLLDDWGGDIGGRRRISRGRKQNAQCPSGTCRDTATQPASHLPVRTSASHRASLPAPSVPFPTTIHVSLHHPPVPGPARRPAALCSVFRFRCAQPP